MQSVQRTVSDELSQRKRPAINSTPNIIALFMPYDCNNTRHKALY